VGLGKHRDGGWGRAGGGEGARHGSGGMDLLVWMGNGGDQRGRRWCGWEWRRQCGQRTEATAGR
jgi:hypothetical protein